MAKKIRKQVIKCPSRKRHVELTYTVSGNWFARKYDIISCPAMYETSSSCNRQCRNLLARPTSYMPVVMNRA